MSIQHSKILLYSDTVSRSAIFCAVATTIERCKTEGVVDVFQVVKAMRAQKPGAIQTIVYKWKNHFYEMKGDVGMSLHEKERNKKMPT